MVSKHRYCLSDSGEVVLAEDTRARTLLVGEGCQIEEQEVKRYGFVNGALPIESKEGKPEIDLGKLVGNIVDLRKEHKEAPKTNAKSK